MKNIRLLTGSLCLLTLLTPAALFAAQGDGPKAKLMAKYDTNKNGVIDGDEIAAIRAAFAAAPDGELKRFDLNKDGKLDDAEIATIKGPGTKDKKEKKSDKKKKDDATPDAAKTDDTKPADPKPADPKDAAAKDSGK